MIKELRNERDRVTVAYRDFIEATVVYIEPQQTILLLDKQDRGACRRLGWLDKAFCEVFIEIGAEGHEFRFRKSVDGPERWTHTFYQIDWAIIGTMLRQAICISLLEDVRKVSVWKGQ
jgi:hypothetical protein